MKEWAENPVCEIVIEALKRELDIVYEQRAECFILDDAVATHVTRSRLLGHEQALQDLISLLRLEAEAIVALLESNNITVVRTEIEEAEEQDE